MVSGVPLAPCPESHGGTLRRIPDEKVFLRIVSAKQGADAETAFKEPVIHLSVMPFNTWQVVKRRMKEKWNGLQHVPDNAIRLLHKGIELRSSSTVGDYEPPEGESPREPVQLQYLIIHQDDSLDNIGLYIDSQVPCTMFLKEQVNAALAALRCGIRPNLTDEGTGATYMMRDSRNKHNLAVFKPKDEEAFAPQNLRGYVGRENSVGLRQGVLSSQQAAREVAAFLVDHESFSGVPETTLVHAKHPKFVKVREGTSERIVWKIGAFQAFVQTTDTAGDFGPQVFGVEDVHRIGILDIRLLNLDRNDGNVLVRRGRGGSKYELIPIDHGLSLPDRLDVCTDDLNWMS